MVSKAQAQGLIFTERKTETFLNLLRIFKFFKNNSGVNVAKKKIILILNSETIVLLYQLLI